MKTLTLIILLTTSQFANALSKEEQHCLLLSTYHEARSLNEKDWLLVAQVAKNRKQFYRKYKFGSKSSNICDIVTSKQYTSRNKLKQTIKEPKLLLKIQKTLSNKQIKTNALYFTSKNNKMRYSTTFNRN